MNNLSTITALLAGCGQLVNTLRMSGAKLLRNQFAKAPDRLHRVQSEAEDI